MHTRRLLSHNRAPLGRPQALSEDGPPDPNDRRSRLAVLTAAGRKAFEEGSRVQQQAERDAFSGLTAEESHQLLALIGKLDRGKKPWASANAKTAERSFA